MRIIVVSDLPHFVTGGAEMQASRLIEAWLDQGHEVICLGRRMGKGPVAIGRHRMEVRRIRTAQGFGRLGRAVTYAFSLAWQLITLRHWADVVYTRFLGEAAATAALLKRSGVLRAPLVATPANARGAGDIAFLQGTPFSQRILRLLDAQCDAINLIAPEMADELREAGFNGRNFSHIPNGIAMRPEPDRRPAASVRFLSVGRLSTQKGYDILIDALSRIREQLSPGQFTIVGDGPERETLQALSHRHGVASYILWAGEEDQAAVRQRLESADVFVLPSRYEGMSNAGLEAMERALPMVLTRCGGLDRHIDSQMGWVVPTNDAAALATAISQAIAAPAKQLTEMGQRCRDKVKHEFDIAVTAERYVELFGQLRRSDVREGIS
ncbi:colanic acid biosynthesis glycosyltransferase WcaL [Lysobacter terrae]